MLYGSDLDTAGEISHINVVCQRGRNEASECASVVSEMVVNGRLVGEQDRESSPACWLTESTARVCYIVGDGVAEGTVTGLSVGCVTVVFYSAP